MAKKKATKKATGPQNLIFPAFDESFLAHHTGQIMVDPEVAIVELVANAWDAGADRVEITWPSAAGDLIAISDDGAGMTKEEFTNRWRTLNYNRRAYQGVLADTPPGKAERKRHAFGRNGVGRHAMFCFAEAYEVDTRKIGKSTRFRVRRSSGLLPFEIEPLGEGEAKNNGTKISATARTKQRDADEIRELIGSRFVADPDFSILVNGQQVTLFDLEHLCERSEVTVEGLGKIVVRRFDAERSAKTSKHHGIAWWVTRRLVGRPTWDGFDGPLLDARTGTAKRYTYVVEADVLEPDVKADWTGFHGSARVNAVHKGVSDHIAEDLRGLMHDVRRSRKKAALEANKATIKKLPPDAQEAIARFAEEVQEKCPTIGERDINNMVTLLTNLEQARSGYALLEKLAAVKPNDLDSLEKILSEWTVTDMKHVLGELRHRLDLIRQLEELVDKNTTDELHQLQPLFERGLWIFGPQFEAISFTSNQTLATIVEKFFGEAALTTPKKRPDFVVLPDASLGVYSSDQFDEGGSVLGFAEIVIVELKRGGFRISSKEQFQAIGYARELRTSGKVGANTKITAHVLGSEVDPAVEEPLVQKPTTVIPRSYSAVLRQAHGRTFSLLKKLQTATTWSKDPDLVELLEKEKLSLFDA